MLENINRTDSTIVCYYIVPDSLQLLMIEKFEINYQKYLK